MATRDTSKIIKALKQHNGNVSATAESLSMSRSTLYKRIRDHKEIAEALEDERETMIDVAETALHDQIRDGNITAIIFFLKTQGRSRGYSEKHEVIQTTRNAPSIDPSKLSDRELEQLERLLAKAGASGEVPA